MPISQSPSAHGTDPYTESIERFDSYVRSGAVNVDNYLEFADTAASEAVDKVAKASGAKLD